MTEYDARGVRHMIGDVQRFGLLSAASIVNRYIAIVDQATARDGFVTGRTPTGEREPGSLAESAALMAGAWLSLVDAAAGLVEDQRGPDPTGRGLGMLALPPVLPGSHSEASLWVHHPSAAPTAVELRATSLSSSEGHAIPAELVTLLPRPSDTVTTSTSQEIRVRLEVPVDQPLGRYHGFVLDAAAHCEPMAISVDVVAQGEPRP